MNLLFISGMGVSEWVVVFFVVLLLFGGKKIPELMRGLGKGIKEFNNAKASLTDEIEKGMKEEDKAKEYQKEA